MSAPLDELYFQWLYSQVDDVHAKNPSRTHWDILRMLYTKEFVWTVPYDGNRIEDGKDLRLVFAAELGIFDAPTDWMRFGCSMLELLVILARKLAFVIDGEPRVWFWGLMDNIELGHYSDDKKVPAERVDQILDRVIWRTYDATGDGGLFPLMNPSEDQRRVELWYQLNAYALERF